jgi:peptide/nickel transport system ATP-binding protein/oligopeptide transport system ATP-binding protein
VSGRTDEVVVMYSGRVVERAPTSVLFAGPAHPYTLALMACRPRLGSTAQRLPVIGGQVTDPMDRPSGCAFHPRCPFATARCSTEIPELIDDGTGHAVACFESATVAASGGWPND